MKRAHRRTHRLAWIVLAPLLLAFVYIANDQREAIGVNAAGLPGPGIAGDLP